MAELVKEKEGKAKQDMKKQYDKHAKHRLEPDNTRFGGQVWEGPYEMLRKVSPVTYELAVPSRRSKSMVAHVNRLKQWHTPEASVLRVVVADADQDDEEPTSRVVLSKPE